MKKNIVLMASIGAVALTPLTSASAQNTLSGWGTVTQVIVLQNEVRVYTDLVSTPNPANCTSADSIGIIVPAQPTDDNYQTMTAVALTALAGTLEVRFNILSGSCSPSNRPTINQMRFRRPS